jgi:sugar phosphate isomerase/epimerase
MQFCVFSKHLQQYGFSELGRALKGIGFEAVDLTVRPKGHIEPESVALELPQAVQELAAHGVRVAMLTTAITSIEEPHARTVLETAAGEGIRFYKLGYYRYADYGTLNKTIREAASRLRELAACSKELRLWGGYHNHSGAFLGANPAHVRRMLEGLDADAVGSYFDVGHAAVEGAALAWLQALDDLSEHIRMVALKDLDINRAESPGGVKVVPMGEGLVQWKRLVPILKRLTGQIGPVSFHCEDALPPDEVLRAAARDKAFFQGLWGNGD